MSAFNSTSIHTLLIFMGGFALLMLTALGFRKLHTTAISSNDLKKSNKVLRLQMAHDKERMRELTEKAYSINERQRTLTRRQADTRRLELLKVHLKDLTRKSRAIEKEITAEKTRKSELEEEFQTYRRTARSLHWAKARGRRIENIPNPKGGFFQQATISKIEPGGVKIRHSGGTANLSIYQLPGKITEEFDLRPPEANSSTAVHQRTTAAQRAAIEKELDRKLKIPRTFSERELESYFKVDK